MIDMGLIFVPMSLIPDDMLDDVVELTDKQKAELFSTLQTNGSCDKKEKGKEDED